MNIHIFQSKENLTTNALRSALEKRGHSVSSSDFSYFETTNPSTYNLPKCDIVFYWNSAGILGRVCALGYIRSLGIPFVNRAFLDDMLMLNKIGQTYKAARCGVLTPKTIIGTSASFEKVAELVGIPFVMKAAVSSCGKQVYLIKTADEFTSAHDHVGDQEVLYQKFIPNDGDFRVHVVGGRAVCAYKRVPFGDNFKANVSQGGSMEKITDQDLLKNIYVQSEKIAASFDGADIVGIDLMRHQETGELYFIEINKIPGIKKVHEVTGVDVAECMAEYLESVVNATKMLK